MVEDSCEACLLGTNIPESVVVGPPSGTMAGNTLVWDLRNVKCVVIPDGVERVGNHWFWRSDIESIEIPASVREIGVEAFCNCRSLKSVTFVAGS